MKATSLQELTNKALRQKGSMYRIGEISISASIPPAVSFAISRLGDAEEAVGNAMSSVDLIKQEVHDGELVLALDGTTVDDAAIQGERMPAEIPTDLPASQDPGAAPLPLEPSADETSADEAPSGWVLPR